MRENIIAWNALGPWFREVKPLVDGVFSLITLGKEVHLSIKPPPTVVKEDEIDALRAELREVKDTVNTLIQALKASKRTIVRPVVEGSGAVEPSPEITTVQEVDRELDSESETEELRPTPPSQPAAEELEEPAEDSFMELVSLEARKYAVEKAITTLETEFYDGRLPRVDFEKSLTKQKAELAQILDRINALREELEASS